MSERDAASAFARGKASFESKDYKSADRWFRDAIALEPRNAEYHAWLSLTLYRLEDLNAAGVEVRRSLDLGETAIAHLVKGYLLPDADHDGSIAAYNRAIEIDPKCAFAYSSRGYYYFVKKQFDRAISDCSRAIEIDPKYVAPHLIRGAIFNSKGQQDRAIADFTRAIEIDPTEADSYNVRSIAYREEGRVDDYLVDRMHYRDALKSKVIENWLTKESEYYALGEQIAKHVTDAMWPELRSSGEKLVELWGGELQWGVTRLTTAYEGTTNRVLNSSHGVGYICLSDRAIHLVSLGAMSQRYAKSTSLPARALKVVFGVYDYSSVEKQDKIWNLPYESVTVSGDGNGCLALAASHETWRIDVGDTASAQVIAGIRLGKSGTFTRALEQAKSAPVTTSPDVFDTLKRLGELKQLGVLTDAEFDEKKRKLLEQI